MIHLNISKNKDTHKDSHSDESNSRKYLREIKHFKIYDAHQSLMQWKINIGDKSGLTSGNVNGLNIFHLKTSSRMQVGFMRIVSD